MLGSVPTAPSWHGLWLQLIEDTRPARGALASALATRKDLGACGAQAKSGYMYPLGGNECQGGCRPTAAMLLMNRRLVM